MSVTTRMFLVVFFFQFCLAGNFLFSKDYQLYYLGGQSNMDGFGYVKDMPAGYADALSRVRIFHGNTASDGVPVDGKGIWAPLRPGHGTGFQSDGVTNSYSDRFGVELSFAKKMLEVNPSAAIALLKYSRGGTSIECRAAGNFGCWDSDFEGGSGPGQGVNQYDHFLAAVRNAYAVRDIDADGEPDRLIPAGILWMQGESDAAYSKEIASDYQGNLKRLLDLLRAAFLRDDLPVAIGRISDSGKDSDGRVWDWGGMVRWAQAAYVAADGNAALITSTDDYGFSDPWHYDSAGYLDLGRKFAEAIQAVQSRASN